MQQRNNVHTRHERIKKNEIGFRLGSVAQIPRHLVAICRQMNINIKAALTQSLTEKRRVRSVIVDEKQEPTTGRHAGAASAGRVVH
ncbi:hypothetical protein CcI49_28170 [Frankia sp. CcI49]|nr:hypothetical protein CcI49_28170 [Frankia sp. CcI49]